MGAPSPATNLGAPSPATSLAGPTDGASFPGVIPELRPREGVLSLTPEDLRHMDQATFSATFARSAIKRAKLAGLRRNAGSPLIPPTDEHT